MSYILDALKKSDQERQTHEGPTLQTIQRPLRQRGARRLLLVLMAIVSALAAATVVGVFLWYGELLHPTEEVSEKVAVITPAPRASVETETKAPQTTFTEVTPSASSAATPGPVVAFSDLPDNIRNDIPPLTFSFHVYSQSPANRTIIINKRRVKEGDEVLQGLRLQEITAEGVILAWQGHAFYINVVENW